MQLSFQKAFYFLATVMGLFALLILAKVVLVPLAFALLIAFILYPVARKIESWGANQVISALLSILGLTIILGSAVYLFSSQIIQLSDNFTDFQGKILGVFADVTYFFNKNFPFLPQLERGELQDKIKTWLNESGGPMLSQTFSSTAGIIIGVIASIIYTFLILIYRDGLVRAMVLFYSFENRTQAFKMFKSVQQVGQKYIYGMFVIILILGFVNSIGLWIIGIDNPFLFGFLAAILNIIPYVGTVFGAIIPMTYAFMSYDSLWMPATIAIYFWLVQLVESNFLTPKIVGGNLKINALTSILSIIIGASVWEIAGMILFLPFAAMLKVVCEEYEELQPVALLIGERNYNPQKAKDEIAENWINRLKLWASRMRNNHKNKEQTEERNSF
jgi:predicted PurR-regulated permease PerM